MSDWLPFLDLRNRFSSHNKRFCREFSLTELDFSHSSLADYVIETCLVHIFNDLCLLTIRGATRAADVTNIFESSFLTLSGALKGGSAMESKEKLMLIINLIKLLWSR